MNNYKDFFKMITIAILIEGTITYINQFFVGGDSPWQMLMSIALGIIIAVSYKIDILEQLDIKSQVPYVGSLLTGILLSRGSNYIYDLLTKITSIQ